MSLDSFPWSSATNYSSGPDTGTATKTDPGYNQITNLVPVGAQAVNFLFNERDVHLQHISMAWQPTYTTGTTDGVAAFQGACLDPVTGLWFRGWLNATEGGPTTPSIDWSFGDSVW